ncbi:MAG: PKD domain-containing protein, partial [Odoribacter sp.]|nr:PKD domain-containing protein [Odoribacter sp.]
SKASRSFVVKSLLEPKFDFLTLDPCSKVAKKLEVQTRGDADTTYLDWGDGTKEYWTKENAGWLWEHVYASNDTKADKRYTVTMRPVNACYKNLSVSKELTVAPSGREVALRDSCYNKNGCYGDYWEFRKHSFGFLKDGYMCTWDFGDGARLSNPADTVKHVYEHPGTYIVVATVEDRCESRVVKDTVRVVGNDSLDFEFEKPVACIGDTVEIRFVQRGKEVFTGLVWTLPGNLFETVRNSDMVKYICRQEGSKRIELSAVASGCPSERTIKTFRIAKTPDVRIDRGRPKQDSIQCVPFGLKLWALDWNDCQTTVRWDFGNGDLSNLQNPETIYREPGKYTVRLAMTTPEGCTDTDTLPIVALKTPVPVVELKDSLVCSTSGTFILTAYNRTEAIEENTYRWMRCSQSVVLSHYPDTVDIPFTDFWGKEDILLCATDTGTLCSDTARVAFVMSEPVKARVEVIPDTVCAGMDVVFRDTTPAGAARTFFFEDGDTNEAGEFERFYGEPGKYPYVVAVENQQGCRDTLRDTVVVYTLPVADFIPVKDNTILEEGLEHVPTDIENGGMRFTNHSRIHPFEWEENRLSYEWDFGDGHFSQEKDPVHSYDNNGNFEVWLRVISAMGCCDSISDVVNIAAIKGLYFPNAMAPASSDPGVNRFQPKGVGLHSFLVRVYTPNGGTCVWQSDKLDAGKPAEYWDGTFNGQPVSAGLYIWEASATFIDGSFTGHLNGVVNVIR